MRPKACLWVFALLVAACAVGGGTAPVPVLALFAGDMRGVGAADGTGAAASFNNPDGIATDGAGNVYVADRLNHTIRKITPAGVVTTLAGTAGIRGSIDGTGAAARFSSLNGVAADSAGNIYVAENFSYTIRKVTPAGMVSTVVGVAGQAGFMPGALPGRLTFPVVGVAVSGTSLYIALRNGVAVVRNRP
jgi:secreted PhoX family phosphatase